MLLWMLYLKFWWLLLPLSVFGHPLLGSPHQETGISERLEPRNGASTSEPNDRNVADLLERRADPMAPSANNSSTDNNDKLLQPMAQPPPDKPVLVQYTLPGPVNGSFGPYGAYKDVNQIINFDFEYPPYTSKKIVVRLLPTQPCYKNSQSLQQDMY